MTTRPNDFVRQLREAPEPTRLALAMAQAIRQHLSDVHDDDAGDDDARTLPKIECAAIKADDLVRALERLVKS
jgi:hypothetical protein